MNSLPQKLLFRVTTLTGLLLLFACGGGGGDGSNIQGNGKPNTETPSALKPSNQLANLCAAPRANSADTPSTLAQEKAYLQSFIDETYLWYNEVPTTLVPEAYPTAQAYFDVLKTTATTASGKPKDQFHFYYPTAVWNDIQRGAAKGNGIKWAFIASAPPRQVVVQTVAPNSPAALQGIQRGDELKTVDGLDVVNDNTDAGVAKINQALFDTTAAHQFIFNAASTNTSISITLQAASYKVQTVQNVKTIPSNGGKVGYLSFSSHLDQSADELSAAIRLLKADNITDLVLDMRYNGGGLLSVASQLAYMIAGPTATQGKLFERTITNDKLSKTFSTSDTDFGFLNQDAQNKALPFLGLKKITILTTQDTASASESVINGLRGIGVTVNLVGSTTRGKPYGFIPQDNCGTTYFAIQFKGVNALGFGDYADGFAPSCAARDDFTRQLGDPSEGLLAAGLSFLNTGSCPVLASSAFSARLAKPIANGLGLTVPSKPALKY